RSGPARPAPDARFPNRPGATPVPPPPRRSAVLALVASLVFPAAAQADGATVRGEVTDATTGKAVACRIYVEGEDGSWHFPKSEAKAGAAVEYRKQRTDNPRSVEMHTTLSAHPFVLTIPPLRYTFTVERGKEYLPETQVMTIGKASVDLKFKLRRWIDMAALGWYSGETHVHRAAEELPTLVLAEDLNVAFPLSYWVTEAFASP